MQSYNTATKPIYPISKITSTTQPATNEVSPLHVHVEEAVHNYLLQSKEKPATQLYNMVLSTIEPALLKAIFKCYKTQREAAKVLGLSRGKLHKMLKQYNFRKE